MTDIKPIEGPIAKAWREWKETAMPSPLIAGRPSHVEVTTKTPLEQQLEASLWAVATLHQSVFTREDLYAHVGPGHMEDDWYVKRLSGLEVHLLCTCQTILVLQRCMQGYDKPAEFGLWCEEPAFPVEGAFRKDVRCGQHHGR